MLNKILCAFFTLALIFFMGCEKESPVAPDVSFNESFSKKTHVPVGTVTPVLSLPAGYSPEGIAVDKKGNMYISNTIGGLNGPTNQILKVEPDGSYYVCATLPGAGQTRGLVTDKKGNVYAAFFASIPENTGVYKIKKNGALERLAGSENMVAPNALTFGSKGKLYATDSDGYAVWKYDKKNGFVKWFEHPLLVGGILPGGPPFPLPGCNGIVFFPPNKLYVANTMQSSVSRITIGHDGEATSIELIQQGLLLANIDGIAVDVHENIYGAMPGCTLGAIGAPPVSPLVKLNPHTGEVTELVDLSENVKFNTPTSLAFGTKNPWDRKSVYMANCAINYGQPMEPWAAPGVVEVYVGVKGKKGE